VAEIYGNDNVVDREAWAVFCRRGHWLLGCDESVRDAAAYLRIGVPGANCVRFRVEFRA